MKQPLNMKQSLSLLDGVDGLEKVEDRDLRVLFGGFNGRECGFAGISGKDVFLM